MELLEVKKKQASRIRHWLKEFWLPGLSLASSDLLASSPSKVADMEDKEAERQIQQMVNFIMNEAKDKADEIEAKALEDFNIEKLKLVQQMKDKIRQEYVRKAKQVETQCAIARSTAINRSRLEKIKARQEMLGKVQETVQSKLAETTQNASKYQSLLVGLITQGLLMLLEDEVFIRCRKEDENIVKGVLAQAAGEYSKIVKNETGATRSVKLSIDTSAYLAPGPQRGSSAASCAGGVVLVCNNGAIKIDNTLDTRCNLVMEQDKPAIRGILFPVK